MKLSMDILYDQLSGKYRLNYARKCSEDSFLQCVRFFDDSPLRQDRIYVIPAGFQPQNTQDMKNGFFISIGEPVFEHWKIPFDLLILEDLVSDHDLFNEIQEIFAFYQDWEDESQDIISNCKDYQELISCAYQYFRIPICLVDNMFQIIANETGNISRYEQYVDNGHITIDVMNELISNPDFSEIETREDIFEYETDANYYCKNFKIQDTFAGRLLVLCAEDAFRPQSYFLIRQLTHYIESMLKMIGSFKVFNSEQNQMYSFLTDSLDRKPYPEAQINRIYQNQGWSLRHRYVLIQFLPEHRYQKTLYAPYLISQLENYFPSCSIEYHSSVVLLLNLTLYEAGQKENYHTRLAYILREGLMIAGISRTFTGFEDLDIYYKQTEFALEAGKKIDKYYWYFFFDSYALEYLLQNGTGIFQPEHICCQGALTLREHDQRRQTDYFNTLKTYFEAGFNMTKAAELLFIHRSTFINRMERIREITKLDIEDKSTRLYLELSFLILER